MGAWSYIYVLFRPEINIKPWVPLIKELEEANKRTKWEDRQPYAFWKGNPDVSATRHDLLKCNVSKKRDWNARVYKQVPFLSPLTYSSISSEHINLNLS